MVGTKAGDTFILAFEDVQSAWRQGVWLGTEGILRVNGSEAPQVVVWSDTSPATIDLDVVVTDGWLRLYNIWDSGRDLSEHESQAATSGMLVDERAANGRRYRCNDIGLRRGPTSSSSRSRGLTPPTREVPIASGRSLPRKNRATAQNGVVTPQALRRVVESPLA